MIAGMFVSRWSLAVVLLLVLSEACSSDDTGDDDDVADGDADADADLDADADADFDAGGGVDAGVDAAVELPLFSFFVTSLDTILTQSGSEDGFGGDLGGLEGADSICQTAADAVGFGAKEWRAFLSATTGPDGVPVHAIDRIGTGPWYDRNERLVAEDLDGLLQERPDGDLQIVDDLPDENGEPLSVLGDSHDILTGSDENGELFDEDPVATCQDWTSAVGPGSEDAVMCGHSWPARSGQNWMSSHPLRGCAAGINLEQNGPGSGDCVGCAGGYGGLYCFALTP
jgi:hypothetical protein